MTGFDQFECGLSGAAAYAAVQRGRGDLNEPPALDERAQPPGLSLYLCVALGMREDRSEPAERQIEQRLFEIERPTAVRKLHEEVPAVLGNRESPKIVLAERAHRLEVDLASMQDVDRNPLFGKVASERCNLGFHPIGCRRIVVTDMRGRGNRRDAFARRLARKLATVLDGSGAVVYAGEHMRVEVDHSGRIGLP